MSSRRARHGPRDPLIDDPAVFGRIRSRAVLEAAWAKVWRNGGAAGGDYVTLKRFSLQAPRHIGVLANSLAEGDYAPGPIRRVDIPKRGGGHRRLSIPCVVDRIAQTAVAEALTPLLDGEFEDSSFAYRPGRSVKQAVARIQALQQAGLTHVVDADIDDFFDTIDHDALLARLGESLSSGPLTALITLWLSAAAPGGRGVAQGSPLSPLLANLFLDRLDEAFDRRGARIVRFADDFVILSASPQGADAALRSAETLLAEQGLRLNRSKTRVTDFNRGFTFLGHLFVRSMALKTTPEAADNAGIDDALATLARQDAEQAEAADRAEATLRGEEARGLAPGFRTLYVTEPGQRLSLRNQAFTVEEVVGRRDPGPGSGPGEDGDRHDWRERIAIPHQRIDRIDLGPEVEALPGALDHALATDTLLCFVDGHGQTRGHLAPVLAPRAGRHLAQAATALDPERRLALARTLVEGRLRNQRALMRKLCRERERPPPPVAKAIAELTGRIGRGDTSRIRHARSVEEALGHEGQGAAAYWRGLSALVPPEFRFPARHRDPAPDPANIALNMLSWLLARDIGVAVLSAGLHPGFGALHGVADRHDACVYDLMEEFRAHMVEGLFVYVANRRILRPDMFTTPQPGTCRMKTEGTRALIRAYEGRAEGVLTWPPKTRKGTVRRVMLTQAHHLARHHEEGTPYLPFVLDY